MSIIIYEYMAKILIKRRPLFVKFFTMYVVRVGKINLKSNKRLFFFQPIFKKKEEFICNTANPKALV